MRHCGKHGIGGVGPARQELLPKLLGFPVGSQRRQLALPEREPVARQPREVPFVRRTGVPIAVVHPSFVLHNHQEHMAPSDRNGGRVCGRGLVGMAL